MFTYNGGDIAKNNSFKKYMFFAHSFKSKLSNISNISDKNLLKYQHLDKFSRV